MLNIFLYVAHTRIAIHTPYKLNIANSKTQRLFIQAFIQAQWQFSDKGTHAAWHLGGAVNLPGGVLDGAS